MRELELGCRVMRGLAYLSDIELGPGMGQKSDQQTKPGRHHSRKKKEGEVQGPGAEMGISCLLRPTTEKSCSSLRRGLNTGDKNHRPTGPSRQLKSEEKEV